MNVTTMLISELKKPERNVRIHTEQQIKEFERSIKMFGQIRPIVVDENNVILAGNGLYDTLLKMGRDTAEVYKFDNLTEKQKKKLMIADNKIFSLGIENLDTLNVFLEEMQGDLDIPGFDEEILKQMVSDAEEVTEKIAEYGTLDDAEIANIKANAARQEQKITSMESKNSGFDSNLADNPQKLADGITGEGMAEETTEIRKFVICPNCGEKIWL
nr:MAG TPA: ParB protein [Caudoviricetes sp.]